MKDSEILLAAIKKAEANGFVMDKHKHFCEIGRDNLTGKIISLGAYQSIIFDHDFAKAIWGTNHICRWCGKSELETKTDFTSGEKITFCRGCGAEAMDYAEFPEGNMMRKWEYYLQLMVIEDNPIKFLGAFVSPLPEKEEE